MNRIHSSLLFLMFFVGATVALAQHPIGYGSLHASSQLGSFSFEELDRTILKEKTAAFYVDRQLDITFDVLVTPHGTVKYVRSPRVTSEFYELRLACASALYDFVFSPVAAETGDRWFKAKLKFEGD